MRRSLAALAALILAGVIACLPNVISTAQTAQPWPTFHGNGNRDGTTNVSGPAGHNGTADIANQWLLPKSVESSPVVDAGGTAYIGDDDNRVYALSPSDPARPLWSFDTKAPVKAAPALSPDGKTLYVGSTNGNFYALKTSDGSAVWGPVQLGGPIQASPAVSSDGSNIYISIVNGTVYSLAASSGKQQWKSTLTGGIPGSPALTVDGSTLLAATSAGLIYALPATGTNAGQSATLYYLNGPSAGTPAVDPNGNLYAATINGTVMAFSLGDTSGASRCSHTNGAKVPVITTPAVSGGSNGVIIVGAQDQNVYALSASSCSQQVWSKKTGAPIESSAAIATANGTAYIGSDDGTLYALKASDGSQVWSKYLGAPLTSSPALTGDGSLWIASNSGYVYRLHDLQVPGTPVQVTGTITVLPTTTPFPTPTGGPSPTPVGPGNGPTVTLKGKVSPGQKQTIKLHGAAKTKIRIRVNYPNGDHQSHSVTTNASGNGTYSYKQGASKIRHNSFVATVLATAGAGTATKSYSIGYGPIDVSIEPRAQSVGKRVDIFVHARPGTRVAAYLLFPNGSVITRRGRTGPKGWASIKYTVGKGRTSGSNRKVTVLAKLQSGPTRASTSSYFTITG